MKHIALLGSTGSIGRQTLEVVHDLGNISVEGISAYQNIRLLEQQVYQFRPKKVAVMNEEAALLLKKKLHAEKVEVLAGAEGLLELAVMPEISTVVTAVVGNVGIAPTLAAIEAGKDIALANKEALVSAGALLTEAARRTGSTIYPVDSEHSAIFQALQGNQHNTIERILLTASGGPFRGRSKAELAEVSVREALNHPNWQMGKKISVDSATMMNKGLEMIEAKWLFGVDMAQIEVLVHPQSIVHSAVEFVDGAVIAQLGEPDMRVPIQYALTYPHRKKNTYPRLDFAQRSMLTFEQPDYEAFACLGLANAAAQRGSSFPAVLNAANEIAVEQFLQGNLAFLEIPWLIEETLRAHVADGELTLASLLQADAWARWYAQEKIGASM